MFVVLAIYTLITLSVLGFLAWMILRIGHMLGDCPQRGAVIRSASISVATGFGAIGAGGVLLIAGGLPLLGEDAGFALMGALGLAAICLGLGFTQAVSILRALAVEAKTPAAA